MTAAVWPRSVCTQRPLRSSHTRSVLSSELLSASRPVGEHVISVHPTTFEYVPKIVNLFGNSAEQNIHCSQQRVCAVNGELASASARWTISVLPRKPSPSRSPITDNSPEYCTRPNRH